MANGFYSGGLATGLTQGFAAGSDLFTRQAANRLAQERLGFDREKHADAMKEAELDRKVKQKQKLFEFGEKLYGSLEETLSGGIASGTSTRDQLFAKLDDPDSMISQQVRSAAVYMGQDPALATQRLKVKINQTLSQKEALEQKVQEKKNLSIAESAPEVITAEVEGKIGAAIETQRQLTALGQSVPLQNILQQSGVVLPPNLQVVNSRDAQGNQVTQVLDMQKGGALVKEIGRGPSLQYQPQTEPGDLTKSQSGKVSTELNEALIAHTNFIQTGLDTVQKIRTGESGITGGAGTFARTVRGVAASAIGIARMAGVNTDFFESGETTENMQTKGLQILDSMKEAAGLSGEIKSSLIEMAFSAAAAQGHTGHGVSDKDFDRFLRQLGEASGNNEDVARVMESFMERADRNFNNRYTITSKNLLKQEAERPNILAREREKYTKQPKDKDIVVEQGNLPPTALRQVDKIYAIKRNDGTIIRGRWKGTGWEPVE